MTPGPGRPARRGADWVGTSLRLPRELLDALTAAADDRDMGRNLLMVRLLQEGYDRLIPVDELTLTRRPAPAQVASEPPADVEAAVIDLRPPCALHETVSCRECFGSEQQLADEGDARGESDGRDPRVGRAGEGDQRTGDEESENRSDDDGADDEGGGPGDDRAAVGIRGDHDPVLPPEHRHW